MFSSPGSAMTLKTAVLSVGLILPAGSLEAATLRVGAPGAFQTVREALEAAAAGDTILVAPGRYEETVVVEKAVRLIGQGNPQLSGSYQGNVVVILADDVEVRGFSISGSGSRMMVSDAGVKIFGARAHIAENRIFDNLFGVYLKGCTEALIERNSIRGRPLDEMGKRGAGIHFFDATYNVVRNNDVSLVRDGVYFDHSDFNTVEGNEFSHLRYGVHYMYCKENSFFRNVFRDSVAGVAVMYTERVTFSENQILNNREGHNAFGLLLKDCLDSVAEKNVIVNNVNGVFLDSSHRNRFENNLIAYNDVGVILYASSLQNRFIGNDFVGNFAILRTVGKADAEWTVDGIGNYYSGYYGYDVDGDGRGDTVHRLQDAFEYLEGNHPLLRLFLNSAAADALAAAERSFPLVPTSDERDTAPSMTPFGQARLTYRYAMPFDSSSTSPFLITGSLLTLLASIWLTWRLRA